MWNFLPDGHFLKKTKSKYRCRLYLYTEMCVRLHIDFKTFSCRQNAGTVTQNHRKTEKTSQKYRKMSLLPLILTPDNGVKLKDWTLGTSGRSSLLSWNSFNQRNGTERLKSRWIQFDKGNALNVKVRRYSCHRFV